MIDGKHRRPPEIVLLDGNPVRLLNTRTGVPGDKDRALICDVERRYEPVWVNLTRLVVPT